MAIVLILGLSCIPIKISGHLPLLSTEKAWVNFAAAFCNLATTGWTALAKLAHIGVVQVCHCYANNVSNTHLEKQCVYCVGV